MNPGAAIKRWAWRVGLLSLVALFSYILSSFLPVIDSVNQVVDIPIVSAQVAGNGGAENSAVLYYSTAQVGSGPITGTAPACPSGWESAYGNIDGYGPHYIVLTVYGWKHKGPSNEGGPPIVSPPRQPPPPPVIVPVDPPSGGGPPPGSASLPPTPSIAVVGANSNTANQKRGSAWDDFFGIPVAKAEEDPSNSWYEFIDTAIGIGSDSICSQSQTTVVPISQFYLNAFLGTNATTFYSDACGTHTDKNTQITTTYCNRCRVCVKP